LNSSRDLKTQDSNSSAYNSDGLIKCLRQPGQLQSQPLKSMRDKFVPFISFTAPRLFRLPGQHLWAGWPTRWRLVFCSHQDYFIVTRNFTAVYLDLLPFRNLTVTQNFSAIFRDSLTLVLLGQGRSKKQVTATPRFKAGQAPGT
jgi:hypothetical protein